MPEKYDPRGIELKWQKRWEADGLYRATIDPARKKHYALTMLPYPSGDMHIGHWYAMTPSDARARFMRMNGYNVMFPMGFDAFGLPAENAAIQRRVHPKEWTYHNIERMRTQMKTMGAMFDWEREAISSDPEYYRWTQWLFLKFYENGLAYRQRASVDFCPHCNTTLAREQVWGEDRHCERCGTPVIKKDLEQWFFRITKYADELLDHDKINWPEKGKLMQKNWIGKSEGAHVVFHTEQEDELPVFTTRPDTLWGATFMVLAPEHPLVATVTSDDRRAEVEAYVAAAIRRTEIERTAADKEKTGVFTGGYAINPVNGARIPIWIADYVLMGYGTGAIMAVPAHDERDFEFAKKYGLPIVVVVQKPGETLDPETMTEAYPHDGVMVNSGPLNGTPATEGQSIRKTIEYLEQNQIGHGAVNYRLRDWLISRQRYWGAPIPIVYCRDCGTVAVPYDQLPVLLPDDVEFMPTGESPLKFHKGFLNTTCPKCGGPATRETDTMDTFMCSSWYHLRYLSPHYDKAPFDPEEGAYWLPVDQYTGGIEHMTMHLMYTRYFTKALRDCGVFEDAQRIRRAHPEYDQTPIDFEPMMALFNQGMILGEPSDGDKVIVVGNWNGDKMVAESITQVKEEAVDQLVEAEKVVESVSAALIEMESLLFGGSQETGTNNTVIGEIVKRTENLLSIERADGAQVTVEVPDSANIFSQDGHEIALANLRFRLSVEKMSKSKGNVVAPDELVAKYGADVVRGYLMFAFRWESGGPWDSLGIQGVVRWLNDVWNLVTDDRSTVRNGKTPDDKEVRMLRRRVHQTIQRVTEGLTDFGFNTSVAGLMELKNTLTAARKTSVVNDPAWDEALSTMLVLMAPFVPHIAEELWERTGHSYSIHLQPWPTFDPEIAREEEITLVVSVNGKVRARINVPAGISDTEAQAAALASTEVQKHVQGKDVKKVIYVGDRGMINIVV